MDGAAVAGPLVGLFGAFDTGDLGEVALRRVIEGELRRRRPDIRLVALAPFGAERPVPSDEGRPARPLRSATTDALGLDALIIAGDVLASDTAWAERYGVTADVLAERGVAALTCSGVRGGSPAAPQVIWFAVGEPDGADVDVSQLAGRDVWVRDSATQQTMGGTAVQSGDPLLLAARVFDAGTLRRRADLLRMCGVQPAGRRLVLEATGDLHPPAVRGQLIEAITAALRSDPSLSLIVLSLNPTAPASGIDIGGPLAAQVHHLPEWVGLDDIGAALTGATAVVATTAAGAHLAAALGTPVVVLPNTGTDGQVVRIPTFASDLTEQLAALLAGGKPVDIAPATTSLDGGFAELAMRLPSDEGTTTAPDPDQPTESALTILQQRLVDERTALQAELSRLQAEIEHLQASPEHRLARPIREGYQRWQRRRT